uniref:Cold-shock protein n=1 Tax=candidate division WOR-3 bacterium TaxID=2052148 RepID=A0A7C2K5C9_UNCW3
MKENRNRIVKATVIYFNENLGSGIARIENTQERIRFSYKEIEGMEGFRLLFAGDKIEIIFTEQGKKVRKLSESPLRAD